jgi:hypothetical protein
MGANLTPRSSAIVAVIEHTWVTEVEKIMREDAKEVASMVVEADIAAQLEEQSSRN